ncbi:glucan 1,4-alpha-maltohexaosidase [Hahella sp. CCB-MM4]|uniref:glucan 1,4-alpha-maltotetraohydrolase domain-containing protein n=1 Tax=Hahella sp. (strain CCB-MM4) TaxID=1926491 RepID=UPI000BC3D09A|nr:glucan 1,4-alpha-maltotetraohydrolase domain-containing protein [Hahella sp. CCB-MM4]OZG75433.1 glucan 1,4-alpha-maltohexaosidase [Hahella sp. CCB-MM4]
MPAKQPLRAAVVAISFVSSCIAMTPYAAADVSGKTAEGVRFHGGDEIILQGFHWNVVRTAEYNWYNVLQSKAADIAADGFTSIWLPPAWRDQSSYDAGSGVTFGGEGYFWTDFNKDSRYGNNGQLQSAAAALTAQGVKVIYDIVPNHHNRGHWGDELDLDSNQGHYRSDCGSCDDGDPFISGDSDFNTADSTVYNLFLNELSNLKNNYNAAGFRFDFVRGYDPARIDAWVGSALDSGYCVGELWKSPGEYPASDWRSSASWQEIIKDFADTSHCSVFDFALKERLQNGSISDWRYGLNGNPDAAWREVAVTFVDNHDTGYSPGPLDGQHHWALPDWKRKMAYAYILTSPGTPVVYWSHMYDWGLESFISSLIQIRKEAGIKAYSPISFHSGPSGLVGTTTGENGKVLFALDSNLSDPSSVESGSWSQVMNEDSGQIRIWKQGGTGGTTVAVNFQCSNGVTNMGDSVYVVGNNATLGNWNAANAVKLDPTAYPTWTGTISLTSGSSSEWKCIIRNESDPTNVIQWEGGANNVVTASAGVLTIGDF